MNETVENHKNQFSKASNFINMMRWMQEKDLDVLTLVTAAKGMGKSNTLMYFGLKYVQKYGLNCKDCEHEWIYTKSTMKSQTTSSFNLDLSEACPKCGSHRIQKVKKFNFNRYLAYDNEEVRRLILELPPYSPILCDEGVRFMMGEDWNKSDSKEMKKLFAQMRTKHLLLFVAVPRFGWVDSKYRNDMTTFWIRVIKRGSALLMIPNQGETDDPWNLKTFKTMLGDYSFFTSEQQLKMKMEKLRRKHPCVYDYFQIPKVPDNIYADYLVARNKKAFQSSSESKQIDNRMAAQLIFYNLYNNWRDLTNEMKLNNLSTPTLKFLAEKLLVNPNTGNQMISLATAQRWIKKIEQMKD